MATKNIGTLQPGQTVTLTGTYKATESDMGKTDLINTVTAKSGVATASAKSAAAKMEAVRYAFDATKTQTNQPEDGKAFDKDETIIWDIKATNTGNQTLSGLKITEKLAGAVLPFGDTLADIAPKGSATKQAQYTVISSDLRSENLRNAVDIANAKTSKSNVYSPFAIIAKIVVPKTQEEFNALSWKKIRNLSEDYSMLEEESAGSGLEKYKGCLGFHKDDIIDYSMFYEEETLKETQFWLVDMGNKEKPNGGNAGFCFMSAGSYISSEFSNSDNKTTTWDNCMFREKLQGVFSEKLPVDLKESIINVNTKYTTGYARDYDWPIGAIYTTEDNLWVIAASEILGTNPNAGTIVQLPDEGDVFKFNLIDANKNGFVNGYHLSTRTPIHPSSTNKYGYYTSGSTPFNNDIYMSYMPNTSQNVVQYCFCME